MMGRANRWKGWRKDGKTYIVIMLLLKVLGASNQLRGEVVIIRLQTLKPINPIFFYVRAAVERRRRDEQEPARAISPQCFRVLEVGFYGFRQEIFLIFLSAPGFAYAVQRGRIRDVVTSPSAGGLWEKE